jgi:hypothetical protein
MAPTAQREIPDTEFMDWPSHSEAFLNLADDEPGCGENPPGELDDSIAKRLSCWDAQTKLIGTLWEALPNRSQGDISSVIRAARALVELGENWDGEGSRGYSLETWKRVKRFLMSHASVARSLFRVLPAPAINPADQGSLDVFWRLSGRQLLVNFPEDESAPITYYGQNRQGDNTISGRTTAGEKRLDLVAWLTQNTK